MEGALGIADYLRGGYVGWFVDCWRGGVLAGEEGLGGWRRTAPKTPSFISCSGGMVDGVSFRSFIEDGKFWRLRMRPALIEAW